MGELYAFTVEDEKAKQNTSTKAEVEKLASKKK